MLNEIIKYDSTWKFKQNQIQIRTYIMSHISCNEWHNDESENNISGPMNALVKIYNGSWLKIEPCHIMEIMNQNEMRLDPNDDHETMKIMKWEWNMNKSIPWTSLYYHELELARLKFKTMYQPRISNQEIINTSCVPMPWTTTRVFTPSKQAI